MSGDAAELHAPRVTVVIPTYNYAEVLPFSIGSVLDQTFADFELLVIGDACTDDSERVVDAVDDRRVHWINLATRSGHQFGPNNEGLRSARGDVIAYLGHDDVWIPQHLALLMDAIDAGAPVAHTSLLHARPGQPCYTTPPVAWVYRRGNWIPPTSLALRRDHAVDVGGWRDAKFTRTMSSEADLLARIFDVAGPPVHVPRITGVKLAASARRDVYRTRPTHEQEHWLALTRESDDPERALGAYIGASYTLAGDRAPLGLPTRAWQSARFRVRKRLRLSTALSAKAALRRAQRFKGSRSPLPVSGGSPSRSAPTTTRSSSNRSPSDTAWQARAMDASPSSSHSIRRAAARVLGTRALSLVVRR